MPRIPILPAPDNCPCCGSEARFGEIEDENSEDFAAQFIICTKCGLTTALIFPCGDDPKPLLLERWNARPRTAPDNSLPYETLQGRGHTAGPWRVYLTTDGREVIGIGDANGEGVADCGFGLWRFGSDEAKANARLIAASPELLEALTNLLGHIDKIAYRDSAQLRIGENTPFVAAARAAIAKATGAQS